MGHRTRAQTPDAAAPRAPDRAAGNDRRGTSGPRPSPRPVTTSPPLPDLPLRELECFSVLAGELHFGRTAERLGVSQGRVSQMIKRLEGRVGGALFERTSRRVALTAVGAALAAGTTPAIDRLRQGFADAQAMALSPERPLRIGFQGAVYESLGRTVAALPAELTRLVELPWADPFTGLGNGTVDVAVVLAPSTEHDFRHLVEFSRQPQYLAVSRAHPLAAKERVTSADLAGVGMVAPAPGAPAYWREANAPRRTEDGYELHYSATATTLQEALSLVAGNRHGVLLCRAGAAYFSRPDVRFVPAPSLPDTSLVALTRHDAKHPLIARFAGELDIRTRTA